jgi:signal transduction histidine kinase
VKPHIEKLLQMKGNTFRNIIKTFYDPFVNAFIFVYFAFFARYLINPYIIASAARFIFFLPAVFLSTLTNGFVGGATALLLSLFALTLLPTTGGQLISHPGSTLVEDSMYFAAAVLMIVVTYFLSKKQEFLGERGTFFKKESDKRELLRKESAEILDSIGDAFLSVDENWKFTYVNAEAETLLKLKKIRESKNKDVRLINSVLFNLETNRFYEEAKKDKTIVSFEYHEDEADKWWHIRAYPKVQGLSIYATDITVRKKIEQERDTILSELNSLVAIAPVGIGFTDDDLKFFMVNRVFAQILEIPEYKFLYQTPYEINPSKTTETMETKMRNVTRTMEATSHEISLKNGKNATYWRMIYYPVKLEEGKTGIGIIAENVTEDKVEQKQKDQFISMVSHELKTPVTAIKAFIQILYKMPVDESTQRKEYYDKVNRHINRLTKLINDLLDISKIRSGKLVIVKEHFDFDKLIEDLTYAYRISLKSHQIIVVGSTNKIVFADRDRISQVYANLLNNAIKYSPGKKKIEVKLSKDSKNVYCTVRDFGVGMNKEEMDKIFASFYRIKDSDHLAFPGLGIGLYISSQIMKLHKGKIEVNSSKARGSEFTFSLPIN